MVPIKALSLSLFFSLSFSLSLSLSLSLSFSFCYSSSNSPSLSLSLSFLSSLLSLPLSFPLLKSHTCISVRPLNGFKACLEKEDELLPPPLIIRLCLDRLAYCCPLCRKDFSVGVRAGGLQRGVPRGGSDSQLRSVVFLRLIPNYVTLSSCVCVCARVCVCETHGNHEKIHQFNMCTLIIKRYFSSVDCRN